MRKERREVHVNSKKLWHMVYNKGILECSSDDPDEVDVTPLNEFFLQNQLKQLRGRS